MLRFHLRSGIAAAFLCLAGLALLVPAVRAHDSNSLHKLGNAIQYPFRKASENTSIAVHRTVGAKSVVHRRNGNRTFRSVVTHNGRIHRLYRVGHHRRYRHHH